MMMPVKVDVVLHQSLHGVHHLVVEAGLPLLHQLHVVCDDEDLARAGDLLTQ